MIDGIKYQLSRIIWIMMKGSLSEDIEVEHEDRIPSNNKWNNLRLATRSQNMMNRRISNNRVGELKGVSKCTESNNWISRITINSNTINLGSFPTKEDAALWPMTEQQ